MGILRQTLCLAVVVVLDVQVGKLEHGVRLHAQVMQGAEDRETLFATFQSSIQVAHLTSHVRHEMEALRLPTWPVGLLEELLRGFGQRQRFLTLAHGSLCHALSQKGHGFCSLVATLLCHRSGLFRHAERRFGIPLPEEQGVYEVLLQARGLLHVAGCLRERNGLVQGLDGLVRILGLHVRLGDAKEKLRAPALVAQALRDLPRLVHGFNGLVWLVEDDVDASDRILHHTLPQFAVQLLEALKAGLRKLQGRLVLFQLSHDLNDHVHTHRLAAMLVAARNPSRPERAEEFQRLLRHGQGLLRPAPVEQPARHGVALHGFLAPEAELAPESEGCLALLHGIIQLPL
mmetsp:Transcript_40066/g.74698  ORF Transcript_40066/g.74698 Transcript_40066/m.74698 type:complete len:345 (-) Transcript_40066:629-1663(-)